MNDYNEKVLKEALQKIAEAEDNEFLKEIEMAKNMPEYQLKDGEAKEFVEKSMPKKRNSKKMFLRVASIFVAVAVCFSAVTLSVDGFRNKFTEFLSNFSNSDFVILGVRDNEEDKMLSSYNGQYAPTYIPDGYSVESVTNESDCCKIVFENADGCMIMYKEQSSVLKTNLDTENADQVDNIEINGMKGIYVIKDGQKSLAITTDSSVLLISCDDADINLIAFAEKIERR